MSQSDPGARRGGSSYTPQHRRTATPARERKGPSGTLITIVGLAVVLVAVVGVGWWLTQNQPTPPEPTPAPVVYVWDHGLNAHIKTFTSQSVTSTVALENVGGDWTITQPIQDKGDKFKVESITNGFTQPLAQSKVIDNPTDLAQFGLASPSLTVTVAFSDTTPATEQLLVGNANLDGTGYYAKSAMTPTVFLMGNAVIEPLRSWFEAPPILEPTPTALPTAVLTLAPTITPTETLTAGATITATTAPITSTNTVPPPQTPTGAPTVADTPTP